MNSALYALTATAVVLILLFLFLLTYTWWTREKRKYWQRYEQKFRAQYFPLLLDYVESPEPAASADSIVRKITQRTKDYSFFINLLNELDEILDGEERERLSHFIDHSIFSSFYRNKLFARNRNDQLYACIYFQNTSEMDDRTLARLVELSKKSDLNLAYAATKALQSASAFSVRESSLHRFFRRRDASDLMTVDLLHLLDSGISSEKSRIISLLKDLLVKDIEVISKGVIIQFMGYHLFYSCSDFLLQYLRRLQYTHHKAPLVRSLVSVLGQFQVKEAVPIIKSYVANANTDISTRLAAVRALSNIGDQQTLLFLMNYLLHAEFPIRKVIIQEMALHDAERISMLEQFISTHAEFIRQIQEQGKISEEKKYIIDKIDHITLGIQIALQNRMARSHV